VRPLLTYPILSCNSNNSYNIIVYNILHRSFRLYLCRLVDTGSLILAKLAFRSCNALVGTCKFVVLGVANGLKSFINFFKLYFFYFTFIFYLAINSCIRLIGHYYWHVFIIGFFGCIYYKYFYNFNSSASYIGSYCRRKICFWLVGGYYIGRLIYMLYI